MKDNDRICVAWYCAQHHSLPNVIVVCCSCWLNTILVLSIDFVARNRVNNLLRANFLYVVGMNVDGLLWLLLILTINRML